MRFRVGVFQSFITNNRKLPLFCCQRRTVSGGPAMEEQVRPRAPVRPEDPVTAAIEPALRFGAACGAGGFLFGSVSGILRGLPPVISGGASAFSLFALGSTFSICRSAFIYAWTVDGKAPIPSDLTKASAAAGGISGGAVGLLVLGRGNAIPSAIMISLFGAAGQHFRNRWTAPRQSEPRENFWKRMSEKSWTPFRVLSNDEYAGMLRERMLRLDVEIAVLDDKIAALKEEAKAKADSATRNAGK